MRAAGVELRVNTDFQKARPVITAGGLIKAHATNNKLRTKAAELLLKASTSRVKITSLSEAW